MANSGHEAEAVHNAAHGAAAHVAGAHGAHHEPHELPNFITLLHEKFPDSPVLDFLHQWENVVFALIPAVLISFVAVRAAAGKKLVPEGLQNFCEFVVEAFESFVTSVLGDRGPKHVPFLATIFFYILFMNWSGLIPLFKSSTAAWSTTAALALVTMVYVQITGVREQGLWHYIKHMAGNPSNIIGVFMVALVLPLNIILEFGAVPFSLSLRLFANVSSEDRLLYNFAKLITGSPFSFPFQLFANILAIVFSVVQAFVFVLLTTVYIALLLPHDDHHEHEEKLHHAH